MIRFVTIATLLVSASAAVAQIHKSVTLHEDEALRLPNGRRIVLTDDHKGKGVELHIEGVGLVRLPKGQSVSVGDFVLTCEAYDLDNDAAILGVAGPPMRSPYRERPIPAEVRPLASPPLSLRRSTTPITRSAGVPVTMTKSPGAFRSTAGQAGVVDIRSTRPSATTQPAVVDFKRQELAENMLRVAEAHLNNALVYRAQFEELIRVEDDIGQGFRKRYHIVVMLYAHRLSLLGVKVPDQVTESAIRRAKRLADPPDPFSVCPACWTPGAKALWEEIHAQE